MWHRPWNWEFSLEYVFKLSWISLKDSCISLQLFPVLLLVLVRQTNPSHLLGWMWGGDVNSCQWKLVDPKWVHFSWKKKWWELVNSSVSWLCPNWSNKSSSPTISLKLLFIANNLATLNFFETGIKNFMNSFCFGQARLCCSSWRALGLIFNVCASTISYGAQQRPSSACNRPFPLGFGLQNANGNVTWKASKTYQVFVEHLEPWVRGPNLSENGWSRVDVRSFLHTAGCRWCSDAFIELNLLEFWWEKQAKTNLGFHLQQQKSSSI
jgi:hypothetical protein